jgi:hypothetical protein
MKGGTKVPKRFLGFHELATSIPILQLNPIILMIYVNTLIRTPPNLFLIVDKGIFP